MEDTFFCVSFTFQKSPPVILLQVEDHLQEILYSFSIFV